MPSPPNATNLPPRTMMNTVYRLWYTNAQAKPGNEGSQDGKTEPDIMLKTRYWS